MDGMLSQDEINALLSGMDLSKGADGDTTADPAKTGDAGKQKMLQQMTVRKQKVQVLRDQRSNQIRLMKTC